MEDMWDIKRVLKSQGNTHNKVEIQFRITQSDFESNSESRTILASN
jgi:hypothetical protein